MSGGVDVGQGRFGGQQAVDAVASGAFKPFTGEQPYELLCSAYP